MKILIISDVHSNIVALEKVWKQESDADLIVSAGDVVDCGPFPRECIDWMIDHDVLAVKGNHDRAVIKKYDIINHGPYHANDLSGNDQKYIDAYNKTNEDKSNNWDRHNAKLLDPHHIKYLKSLPNNLIVDINGFSHGIAHMYKGYDIIDTIEEFERFSNEQFGKIIRRLLFGHTHKISRHFLRNDAQWINPGSVSYRHGERIKGRADYMTYSFEHYQFKSVQFSNEKLHQAVHAADVCGAAKQAAFTWW